MDVAVALLTGAGGEHLLRQVLGRRIVACWVLGVACIAPACVNAQEGVARFLCEDSRSSARWSFSIDFDNQMVNAEVPVNWTWITPSEVLFAHAAFASGRQYLTQLYTLDRRTGAFEMCDYGGDSEAREPCTRQYVCRATLLAFDNAF
jgi:hypothetical protein